jgi:hypothetical protein
MIAHHFLGGLRFQILESLPNLLINNQGSRIQGVQGSRGKEENSIQKTDSKFL